MTLRLLTEHHLKFINLKGGCTGSSVFTLVKIPQFLTSHVATYLLDFFCSNIQFHLLLSPNLSLSSFYILIYMFYEIMH